MTRRMDLAAHLAALDAMPARRPPTQPTCACALTGAACPEATQPETERNTR